MYFLFTDESNADPNSGDFFIYGGMAFPVENADGLSNRIDQIRDRYDLEPDDKVKFNTVTSPDHLDPSDHKNLKKDIIKSLPAFDCKIFSFLVSHKISKGDISKSTKFLLDQTLFSFNNFLERDNDSGMVFSHRIPSSQLEEILRKRFRFGIKGMPHTEVKLLENILGLYRSSGEASHYDAVNDVVLGSLRFIVNSVDQPGRFEVAQTLSDQLQDLCFEAFDSEHISKDSISFHPKKIAVRDYYEDYKNLKEHLEQFGLSPMHTPVYDPIDF